MKIRLYIAASIIFGLIKIPMGVLGQPAPGDTELGAADHSVENGGGADIKIEIWGWIIMSFVYIFVYYIRLMYSLEQKSLKFFQKKVLMGK
jgi:hypothetical protein